MTPEERQAILDALDDPSDSCCVYRVAYFLSGELVPREDECLAIRDPRTHLVCKAEAILKTRHGMTANDPRPEWTPLAPQEISSSSDEFGWESLVNGYLLELVDRARAEGRSRAGLELVDMTLTTMTLRLTLPTGQSVWVTVRCTATAWSDTPTPPTP